MVIKKHFFLTFAFWPETQFLTESIEFDSGNYIIVDHNVLKSYSSSQMLDQNKLECLSLSSLFRRASKARNVS
jgi:hypothetical protein